MSNDTQVTIEERGNGFPLAGDYVPGDDGNLWRIDSIVGQIQTGRASGAANFVRATATMADWDDVAEGDEGAGQVIV